MKAESMLSLMRLFLPEMTSEAHLLSFIYLVIVQQLSNSMLTSRNEELQ